jgi:hypothetical protein
MPPTRFTIQKLFRKPLVARMRPWIPLSVVLLFWAKSYLIADLFSMWRRTYNVGIGSVGGAIHYYRTTEQDPIGTEWETLSEIPDGRIFTFSAPMTWGIGEMYGAMNGDGFVAFGGGPRAGRVILGIGIQRGYTGSIQSSGPIEFIHARVPYWLIAIPFAIPRVIAVRKLLRARKRTLSGCCPECGYDLRASPDRCPECGWKIMVQPPA